MEAKNEKMSYEQLENIAHQLSEQNRNMYAKLQELQSNMMLKRLDFLFRVLENERMFPDEYIDSVVDEIRESLTIPDKEDNESETE